MDFKLRLRFSLAIVYLFLVANAVANDKAEQEARPLLKAAAERSLLSADRQFPFRLDTSFIVHGLSAKRLSGRYSWLVTFSGDWAKQLAFADFSDLQIGRGDTVWVKRSAEFQPLQAALVQNAFHVQQYLDQTGNTIDRYYTLSEHHKKLRCADISRGRLHHTACIDPNGNLSKVKQGLHIEYEYSDYRVVGEKILPHKIVATRVGTVLLEINVDKLSTGEDVARNVPEPPEGSIQRAGCLAPSLPRLKDQPRPDYPSHALDANHQGQVILYVQIGKDGKVQKAVVTQSAGESLDSSVMDAVQHAQYEPAMCGTTPVESETELSNTFFIQVLD
ncbi:MAG TPA: energy transducer TonB [Terriglobales bacterium]|nr:energy transducer TonB [Terriglobales bacterium]